MEDEAVLTEYTHHKITSSKTHAGPEDACESCADFAATVNVPRGWRSSLTWNIIIIYLRDRCIFWSLLTFFFSLPNHTSLPIIVFFFLKKKKHGSSIHGRYSKWSCCKWKETPPGWQDFLSSFPGQWLRGQKFYFLIFFVERFCDQAFRASLGLFLVWPSSHSRRGWFTGSELVVDFLLRITSWYLASHVCPPSRPSYSNSLELCSYSKRPGLAQYIIFSLFRISKFWKNRVLLF